MTAIVDYGVGNLFSLRSSFAAIGEDVCVTADESALRGADRIVLPGVGAFRDAKEKLERTGLIPVLREQAADGKPILGICLGMQMMFEKSLEYGEYTGLGFFPGTVAPIADAIPPELKIPHMGWNALHFCGEKHPLFRYLREGDCVYFVHSYAAVDCGGTVIATAEYGVPITAAAAKGSVMGCQFHPEKSGAAGLSILRAFGEMKRGALC